MADKKIEKKEPVKPGHTYGKWIYKTTTSTILMCKQCGGKYIKTRDDQRTCVRCIKE